MNLTRSEQATLHFYQWERWGRGYYLFETPIDIEPPYQRFQHSAYAPKKIVDDGRVPSLFARAKKLFAPSKETEVEELPEIIPQYLSIDAVPKYVAFSLSFPKEQEIQPRVCQEFLGILSYTNHPISFEIIGMHKEIRIQIVCSEQDEDRVTSQLGAYFPSVQIVSTNPQLPFDEIQDIAICDFGISDEFIRPIQASDNFRIDPLTSIIATMETLKEGDVVTFQTIFKGVTAPWGRDMLRSVSDGMGGSFFADAPEMLNLSKEKVSSPLFSAVFRIGAQGNSSEQSSYLASELARSITTVSQSEVNKLIPLSNEGYKYDFHRYNLLHRTSNRLGCIVNAKELATFVHYPNNTVVSKKLGTQSGTTKQAPHEYVDAKYFIGINQHQRQEYRVGLTDEARLRHIHVIGATGVGKSTLLANMVITDAELGNGCAMFDPHGDIVEDIMARIPEHRINDVILIDPSDTECPVGFNLLHATTEAEKIVLSSDLTGAFKRFATAWGDNMSAVLQQAINAFLDNSKGGTLIELKRFLLEEKFRNNFLDNGITDPSIHYYWQYEYPMVKKGIAPLLTRIDTFLRPKIVRYMLAQKGGVDFRECIEQKKIVLIKLSQGLIGAENSYLLGSLFLSKFNQVTMGRQNLPKSQRHPFYIYCDEFQNFITDSISSILSGARKYGLGLTLAHQELAQIDDTKVLNSVISNPFTRICFRLGDTDAKKLANGFSTFSEEDMQSLGVGEAIVRIGSSANDCNVKTYPLIEVDDSKSTTKRQQVVSNTREKYGMPREDVERLLQELLPKISKKKEIKVKEQPKEKKPKPIQEVPVVPPQSTEIPKGEKEKVVTAPTDDSEISKKKKVYLEQLEKQEQVKRHREIQTYVQTIARQRGFKAEIEKQTTHGGRVDVVLTHKKITIAIEVAITNSIAYEVQNVQKCLSDNYSYIYVISESDVHLRNIQERLKADSPKTNSNIFFLQPQEFIQHLDNLDNFKTKQERKIQGYRVKTDFSNDRSLNSSAKQSEMENMIINAMRKKK